MISRRLLSSKLPKFPERGNILFKALRYVQDVDNFQKELQKTPQHKMADELVAKIKDNRELLFLLALFHRELARVGITPDSSHASPSSLLVWAYRFAYVIRLRRLHDLFWDQCHFLEVAEQQHSLGFLPHTIGVLDPKHFPDSYSQLQLGVYNGVDYSRISALGLKPFTSS